MYAVVRSGGKQYRVSPGDVLQIEKLDTQVGEQISLGDVLMVSDGENVHLGADRLANARVTATVTAHGRGRKIVVFKSKRRKGYRRKQGQRQHYTELAIQDVEM
ncbi:MAG: 50S ribosomal protein L21 [Syntrophobacteria bacterium]